MSDEPTVRRLDFANKNDYVSAVEVMVQSFAVLPTWSYLYRPDDTSAAEARVKYYLHAVEELGEIWAFERDKIMLGVIAFTPPGKIYSDASTVARDQQAVDEALGPSYNAPDHSSTEVVWSLAGFDVPAALASSWKITLLGTIPSAAGQGIGSRMSQFVVDRAADNGEGVWVWTSYQPRSHSATKGG